MRTTLNNTTHEKPELWKAVYRVLEQSIVANQLQAWIQPLELIDAERSDGGGLRVNIAAPNDFSAQWVRDHHRKAFEAAFTQVTGNPCEIVFSVGQESTSAIGAPSVSVTPSSYDDSTAQMGAAQSHSQPTQSNSQQQHHQNQQQHQQQPVAPAPLTMSNSPSGVVITGGAVANTSPREAQLESRYTFESFVVGASNQFAHASAVAVAEQPGRQYNPLFLYSPPGLGKTHLLHAIGNHFLAQNPKGRVAYLSAEKFVNELVESVQRARMPQFRAKYRDSFDLILIDDIQFIAKKSASEEEFFHTFNALHSSKRQIVVTCDRPPKEIDGLEERVRTRFEWGLIADICPPEIETRIAILKAKAERDDIYLPDDVATFLASYIKTNVRELEGVLIRLQAQSSLTGAEISLEMAKHELKTAVPEEGSNFTIESIHGAVAKHFHIRPQDLKSTSRARTVALPRQIAMFLVRKYTGLGYKEIGQYFGGKDHSTVMHGCKKIEEEFETDSGVRDAVEGIQNLL